MKENYVTLYPSWEEAAFIQRLNRFVMELRLNNRTVRAQVPNTGRMEEFLYRGSRFFLTPTPENKYKYKVISTRYENSFILLDTIRVNRIVEHLLETGKLRLSPDIGRVTGLKREFSLGNSRFDFLVQTQPGPPAVLEVKSCTLSHNGHAMFPDAPTLRGRKHLTQLNELKKQEYRPFILYLIFNQNTTRFSPNRHTDLDYANQFYHCTNIHRRALKLKFINPVTYDPGSLEEVIIAEPPSILPIPDQGYYILILYNPTLFKRKIGRLGERSFIPGHYVYIGSALNNLSRRLNRHRRSSKKRFWHIDYISPDPMPVIKTYPIRSQAISEHELALKMKHIADDSIPGFGASDSSLKSHLFYFTESPVPSRYFQSLLLDLRHRNQ